MAYHEPQLQVRAYNPYVAAAGVEFQAENLIAKEFFCDEGFTIIEMVKQRAVLPAKIANIPLVNRFRTSQLDNLRC